MPSGILKYSCCPFLLTHVRQIARDLLSYRWHNLAGAHKKALANGYRVPSTPGKVPGLEKRSHTSLGSRPADRTKIIRIWGGDIEIHISADIAYAIWQYWQATGDKAFLLERGAEIILDTARFWDSRVEWNPHRQRFEIHDIIGPDEYHDRVDNNIFTNAMARSEFTDRPGTGYLDEGNPSEKARTRTEPAIESEELRHWQEVIECIYLPLSRVTTDRTVRGYYQRKDIDLTTLGPRSDPPGLVRD